MLEARHRLRLVFAAWLVTTLVAAGLYLEGELEGARWAGGAAGAWTLVLVDLVRVVTRRPE